MVSLRAALSVVILPAPGNMKAYILNKTKHATHYIPLLQAVFNPALIFISIIDLLK
jgi:hypothetical protein